MSEEEHSGIMTAIEQMEKNLSGQINVVKTDVSDIKDTQKDQYEKIEKERNRITALEKENEVMERMRVSPAPVPAAASAAPSTAADPASNGPLRQVYDDHGKGAAMGVAGLGSGLFGLYFAAWLIHWALTGDPTPPPLPMP